MSDNRRWWGLGVLLLPVLLVSMDSSVLFLAMPMVTDGLDPSPTQTLWILDSYSFVIAGLLITTEAAIADAPKKDAGHSHGPAGGMPDMGGMDF